MKEGFYTITEYCMVHHIDPSFIYSLQEEGLIEIALENNESFIEETQLHDLEVYTRLYTDLGVNTQGIDVIRHLLQKMKDIHTEISHLKSRLSIYEGRQEAE